MCIHRRCVSGILLVSVLVLWCCDALAYDWIWVDSKTVQASATGVTVNVWVVNSTPLVAFVLPLEIRTVSGGAYITGSCTFKLPATNRIGASPIAGSYVKTIMGVPLGEGDPCSISDIRCGDHAYTSVASPVDFVSPDGFFWTGWSQASPPVLYYLPAGSDSVAGTFTDWPDEGEETSYPAGGSFNFLFNVNASTGQFEIDTVCVCPASHLSGNDLDVNTTLFGFTKGVITTAGSPHPPVANCQNTTVPAGAGCEAPASMDNGSFDPDGGPITKTQMPPGPYPLGTTPVALMVVDNTGLADTCWGTVTVVDQTPPIIQCPADIGVPIERPNTGAVVGYGIYVHDECPPVNLVCVPPSGSFFPIGSTRVNCTATDVAGNSANCSFSVLVWVVNSPPLAANDSASTDEGTPVVIDVLANDMDFEGPLDQSTVSIVTAPIIGTAAPDPVTGKVTYAPKPDFTGPDIFAYTVRDMDGAVSNVALVSVTVRPAPCYDRLVDATCDGVINVFDVVTVVNVAFRGASPDSIPPCTTPPRKR